MLLNSDKQKKENLTDFVSKIALPSFREGNLSYLSILHSVFALDKARHIQIEIADAYVSLLSQRTIKQFLYIEEHCRCYPMYYDWDASRIWKPCWSRVNLSRKHFRHLSDPQYLSVLKLGTFHTDGYCRQKCMEELSVYTDTLPFFILRMNDWVEEIREPAYTFAGKRLETCGMHELFSAMPMLDKLINSRRRKAEYVNNIKQTITAAVISKAPTIELDKVHTYDITIRNSIYRFVGGSQTLSLDAMETLLHHAKDSYGKRMLIRGILYHYDIDPSKIEAYLKNKNGIVRYETLVYRYGIKKEPWEGLTELLMDKIKRIRLEAGYILEKHNVLNVLEYYKKILAENVSVTAIYGIGEHGSSRDIDLIKPYLKEKDERLVKAALTTYMNLTADKGGDICWKYLLDSRVIICKCAFTAIKKYKIHYGSMLLYNEYQKQDNEMTKKYLLELICTDPSTWGRLPYLLKLWGSDTISKEQEDRLLSAIGGRSMYAHVTQKEAQTIRELLDQLSQTKPISTMDQLKKKIEFDLKFVTKTNAD